MEELTATNPEPRKPWKRAAEGDVYQRDGATLVFDGTHAKVTRKGLTWEEPFGHPDHLEPDFHRALDAWLKRNGLPGADGLGEVCARIEDEELEREVAEQVRRYEDQLLDAQAKLDDAKAGVSEVREGVAGGFVARVANTRADLMQAMRGSLAPPEIVPGSGGVILRGVRHLWPMERKGGKSLAAQVTAVDIALAGGSVVILDRENGLRRFVLRLRDIVGARGLSETEVEQVAERIRYYEWPRVRGGDGPELVAEIEGADLVVFDSSRMFLSAMDLAEDKSDDYAKFMDAMIDPLHQEGVATLVLDNAGWTEKGRARGTSAKEDLNEQLFHAEKTEDFDIDTEGEILLGVKESRDGVVGTWSMRIGGGTYGSWQREDHRRVGAARKGSKSKKAENVAKARDLLDQDPDLTDAELAEELGVHERTARNYRAEID